MKNIDTIIKNLITAERNYNNTKIRLLNERCRDLDERKHFVENKIQDLCNQMDSIYEECVNNSPRTRWENSIEVWDSLKIENLHNELNNIITRKSYIQQQIAYYERKIYDGIDYYNEMNNLVNPFEF